MELKKKLNAHGRAKPSSPSVVLEVTQRAAKVMVATPAPFQIQRITASTLSDDVGDPVSVLRALLESHPLKTKEIGLILGREAFSLRTLELPSVNPKEIASMLELQLGKLTPYSRSDIISSWTTIGSLREGYTSVLLAIAPKQLIDAVLRYLKAKDIQPRWVGVSTEGLASWWEKVKSPELAVPSGQLVAVIDVDFSSTDCAVFSEGRLVFTHSVATGYEQLTASDQAMQRWVGELVRLPRILPHEDIKGQIGRGLITGVTQGLEPLVEQLTNQWGVAVQLMDPLNPFAPSATVRESAKKTRVSYAALSGVAAFGRPPRIDLIPHEVRVLHALRVRSRNLGRLAGSLAVIMVLAAVLYIERLFIMRQYLNKLERRLATVEQEAGELIFKQQTMKTIRSWLNPSHNVLGVLNGIAEATDSTVAISAVSIRKLQPVTIRGNSDTLPDAFAFLERLKSNPIFVDVQARSIAKRRGADEAGAEFDIICNLSES